MCWQPDFSAHDKWLNEQLKKYYIAFQEYVQDYNDNAGEEPLREAAMIRAFCIDARTRVTTLLKQLRSGHNAPSVVDNLAWVSVDWELMLGLNG